MILGIDIGSVSTNAVLLDDRGQMVSYAIVKSGYDHRETVEEATRQVLQRAGAQRSQISYTVGTGYGRRNIATADRQVTEITCHAVGVRALFPDAQLIIDIGGQDAKAMRISEQGFVENFVMNDKCSAGTGRFLEVMAGALGMSLVDFARAGLEAEKPYPISSTCTVFAESEVISGIAKGVSREALIAGIEEAVLSRVLSMASTLGLHGQAVLTGGVAKNQGIAQRMCRRLTGLLIPQEPQITGAYGAALIGLQETRP